MWCDLLVFLSDGNVSHFEGWDGMETRSYDKGSQATVSIRTICITIQTTIFKKNGIVRMTNWVFNFGVRMIYSSPPGIRLGLSAGHRVLCK